MRPIQRFTAVFLIVTASAIWAADRRTDEVSAQSASSQKGGLYGDWEVKVNFNGRQRTSILSFSRDPEGNQTGQWISFWGLSELKDVKCEGGNLSFTREGRNRDGQSTTWKFTGTIKEGKLSGTASSDRGEQTVEGKRIPRLPDIVGTWAMGYMDLRVSTTLAIQVDKHGKLTAKWKDPDATVTLTDFAYKEGRVSFTYRSYPYEGRLRSHKNVLSGVMTTERGAIQIAALRVGTALIGTWNLEVTSERGSRRQRLKIRPDMSGWYGATSIELSVRPPVTVSRRSTVKSASLEGSTVTFKALTKVGERTFETSFAGKVSESKLSGEITTSRGSAKVVGKKVLPDDDRFHQSEKENPKTPEHSKASDR